MSYLRAAQAAFGGSGLSETSDSDADVHGFPVSGCNNTSQSMSWVVHNATAQPFVVNVLIADGSGTIKVSDGSNSISHTYSSTDTGYSTGGWDKLDYGQLQVPAGTSTITIAATATTGTSMSLLSLKLTPAGAAASLAATIAAGRSQATWMKDDPIGVMYQWGQWGPIPTAPSGPGPSSTRTRTSTSWRRDKAMGATFVVWSITWTQYYVAAPIASVDAVLPAARQRTTT